IGISQSQCKQSYTHMNMELKKSLRRQLLKWQEFFEIWGVVPPQSGRHRKLEGWGFVKCWGWKACLSATDVAIVLSAILDVGSSEARPPLNEMTSSDLNNYNNRVLARRSDSRVGAKGDDGSDHVIDIVKEQDPSAVDRFWKAYDALGSVTLLNSNIPTAQYLQRAIMRTGTSLLEKRQIKPLNSFRLGVVKEGPDVQLFTHPGALIKLALWLAEAIIEVEGKKSNGKGGELVMAGLDERLAVYTVVGVGGGGGLMEKKKAKEQKDAQRNKDKQKEKENKRAKKAQERQAKRDRREAAGLDSDEESEETEEEGDEDSEDDVSDVEDNEQQQKRGYGRSEFGLRFQEVAEKMGARTNFDSFEHCVVQIRKEDLSPFLEMLSQRAVTGQ
ncbi:hypothetical protein LTS18_011697, partial [Coniosporium uncinatum]